MKILGLIPCLMLENNRNANYKAMEFFRDFYGVDEIVVFDQEFKDEDYKDGFKYIGHAEKRVGFVKSRNELLKYFYNSDFDYALWMDANGWFSKTSLNSLSTIIESLKDGNLDIDVILSTLGIVVSGTRMFDKKRDDYFQNCVLYNTSQKSKENLWMHGLIMKNFKKYYDLELYCDRNVEEGVAEDIYFIRLLKRFFQTFICADLTVSKPSNKTSTWMNDQKSYNYPPTDYSNVEKLIDKNNLNFIKIRDFNDNIILSRCDEYKEFMKSFISRKKKQDTPFLGLL